MASKQEQLRCFDCDFISVKSDFIPSEEGYLCPCCYSSKVYDCTKENNK